MNLSPSFCHFVSSRARCCPQHFVLTRPQSVVVLGFSWLRFDV
jgi:hypothetical protein